MHYLLPTTKKSEKNTEFYIYHLRKYRMNLRFTFYESLQAQCSKQEYKFVYKILYTIYSQSKKNDQKTDYRIITVSDRFQPSNQTKTMPAAARFSSRHAKITPNHLPFPADELIQTSTNRTGKCPRDQRLKQVALRHQATLPRISLRVRGFRTCNTSR